MDRPERIDSRPEGPGWVLPVKAGERAERRGGRDRQEPEPRERRRRFPRADEPDETPAVDALGHVDISA